MSAAREATRRGIDWWAVILSTLVTVGALFGLQEWYRSYQYATTTSYDTAVGVQVADLQATQRQALETGPMPIDRAVRLLAERGRGASPLVTPEPSTDPAPAAGWMHHPSYQAPPPLPEQPATPQPEAPPAQEEARAAQEEPAPTQERAPAQPERAPAERTPTPEPPAAPAP